MNSYTDRISRNAMVKVWAKELPTEDFLNMGLLRCWDDVERRCHVYGDEDYASTQVVLRMQKELRRRDGCCRWRKASYET